jgi:hypothetical protein
MNNYTQWEEFIEHINKFSQENNLTSTDLLTYTSSYLLRLYIEIGMSEKGFKEFLKLFLIEFSKLKKIIEKNNKT